MVAEVGLEPHDLRVMSPTSYQLLHSAILNFNSACSAAGAGDRGRTGTILSYHWILSPRRLPVPPHRLGKRNAQPFFIAYLLYHFPHALSTPFCSFLFIFCTTFFDFAFIFKNVTKPQPRRFAVFRTLRRPKWYN